MEWFIFVCYILMTYGFSVIVTHGIGPFNIFFRLRLWAEEISDNFGMLFKCMLCFPTNLGIVLSLLNWFLLPNFGITPFNIIFDAMHWPWYLCFVAALFDGCLTGGVCAFIWNIDDYIDKSTPIFEEEEEHFNDRIDLDDEL
jgi:hypothetical protein